MTSLPGQGKIARVNGALTLACIHPLKFWHFRYLNGPAMLDRDGGFETSRQIYFFFQIFQFFLNFFFKWRLESGPQQLILLTLFIIRPVSSDQTSSGI